jgi:hypothetical protein
MFCMKLDLISVNNISLQFQQDKARVAIMSLFLSVLRGSTQFKTKPDPQTWKKDEPCLLGCIQ